MADETKGVAGAQTVFEAVADGAHAPIIFFDAAGPDGHMNGLILLSITAVRQVAGGENAIRAIPTVQAHLRTNIAGAVALRAAIDDALKLAQRQTEIDRTPPPAEGKPN